MDSFPEIVCFKHCNSSVFCLKMPYECPICHTVINSTNFPDPPFSLPYPFIRAKQYPCAVVIKPTKGDFINDYKNATDLHIGVTDSKGITISYDERGIQYEQSNEWNQCLLLVQMSEPWIEHWDETLREICKQICWQSERYDERDFNCFTFILTFLQALEYENLSNFSRNKTQFCEKYIIPKTTVAGKYISLYRKLIKEPYYVEKNEKV